MQTVETTRHLPGRSFRAELGRFLASLGQGISACIEAPARLREFERLRAMTDDELARLGIEDRGDIVRYVFRDPVHA